MLSNVSIIMTILSTIEKTRRTWYAVIMTWSEKLLPISELNDVTKRERERGVNTELWEERSWQADGVEAAGVIIRCSPPVMTQSPTHCQHTCHWSPCTPSIITCPHFPHQLCVLTPRKPVLTPRSSCVSAPRSGNWLRSSTPAAGRSAGSYLTFDSLRGLLAVWRPASLPAVMPSSAHMWRRCECQSQQQPAPPHLRRSAGTN